MKKGQAEVIAVLQSPDIGGRPSRSSRRAAASLPRQILDRKEDAKHGLLAIEVQLVGAR
jgi:hypothetical protein